MNKQSSHLRDFCVALLLVVIFLGFAGSMDAEDQRQQAEHECDSRGGVMKEFGGDPVCVIEVKTEKEQVK